MNRDAHTERSDTSQVVEQQERGVLALLRIIKALLKLGHASQRLQWTIVTGRTQRVRQADSLQVAHAGVVGLVGSLAKEYPHWDLRLLDLESLAAVSARECLTLPWSKYGDPLAHRRGEWQAPGLALLNGLPEPAPAYRDGGVYVVIGGAGGLGELWSRYMIEQHRAQIVWIGRQPLTPAIEAKRAALGRLGTAPHYVSADATRLDDLERARRTILEAYPAIHGVVHSAVVLRDQGLARMDESDFRACLAAKVDVSVNLDRVFGPEPLDFMLFFSSVISTFKAPGQSNYAAGCTFKDSFAHELQSRRPYPVKLINWGYWGNVGVAADEFHNGMMRKMGIGSIEPNEGLAVLRSLVGSELGQLALLKTLDSQVLGELAPREVISYYPKAKANLRQLPELELVARASA